MKHHIISIVACSILSQGYAKDFRFPLEEVMSISGDCNDYSEEYRPRIMSSYVNPRSVTNDLTYRNSNTFFQRFRGDASAALISFDSTFLYQQNRKTTLLGRGFLGENPLLIAQDRAPFNSLHLGLRSQQPEGYSSSVRLSPKRALFAWLPQIIVNFKDYSEGTWLDIACAIIHAKHHIGLFEQQITPADSFSEPHSVHSALEILNVFPTSRNHTGVDDIQIRLGYVIDYCEDDIVSLYVLGSIPTGEQFDNTAWFQPHVGSRRGGIGGGMFLDGTLWQSDLADTECLFMTEIKYLYSLSISERRQFDLKNGPLSRFLRIAQEETPHTSISGIRLLRAYAEIQPQHSIEWWTGFHYSYGSWGFEGGYNLWYRSAEKLTIQDSAFDFSDYGIFDMTRNAGRTSQSTAKISNGLGDGTPDKTFIKLTINNIDKNSAAGKIALTNTFSAAVTYNSSWGEYPLSFAWGTRYEIASEHAETALENWGIFGKCTMSY